MNTSATRVAAKSARNATRKVSAHGRRQIRQAHEQGIVMRLRRAEGQIRGILRLIEAQASCEDVAQQLAAVRQALDRVFFEMMACSLEMEVTPDGASNARHQRVAELLNVLRKYA